MTLRVLRIAVILFASVPLVCWLLVLGGGLSAWHAADFAGIAFPFALVGYLLVPVIAFRAIERPSGGGDHDGPGRMETLLVWWTRASLIVQLTWELPFVLCSSWLVGVGASNRWAWYFWDYGVADHRYLTAESFIVAMETVTAVAGGAAQLYALYLYRRGNRRAAALWGIGIGVSQFYGATLYFATAALRNLHDIDVNDAISLWSKFVFLNAMWLVMPAVSVLVLATALYRNHPRLSTVQADREHPDKTYATQLVAETIASSST